MKEAFSHLIEKHKAYLKKNGNAEEQYKWEAILHFQQHWNIDADDFYAMFKEAFGKKANLIYQNSYGFLDKLGQNFPSKLKELFSYIYHPEESFEAKLTKCRTLAAQLLPDVKSATGKTNLNHQFDERTLAFLLFLNEPEKYYLYKASVYTATCRQLGQKKINKAGKKYSHFAKIGDQLTAQIQKDKELTNLYHEVIPQGFQFDSTKLIFQDILYVQLNNSINDMNRETFSEQLLEQVQEEFARKEHPLADSETVVSGKGNFIWLSAVENIPMDLLHYEILFYKGKISLEFHPEGTEAQKARFSNFTQQFQSHKEIALLPWGKSANENLTFNKLVYHPTLNIEKKYSKEFLQKTVKFAVENLINFYSIINTELIIYLNKSMRNVKQDFIQWMIKRPKPNYFKNEEKKLDKYLTAYNTYFDPDIFSVSETTYQNIIQLISSAAEDKSSAFFKYSDKESTHRPRAILGTDNYFKFLNKLFDQSINTNTMELNQILYGPPGTGKTYHTIDLAVQIAANNRYSKGDHTANKLVFNELVKSGQIVFSTFHQSMSYEDFVEGIKPDLENDSNTLSYNIEHGIFKKTAIDASFSIYKESIVDNGPHEIIFPVAYDILAEALNDEFEKEGKATLKSKSGSDYLFDGLSAQGNILMKHAEGKENYTVSKPRLERLHEGIGNLENVKNILNEFRSVIGGSNASIYWAVLNAVRELLEEGRIQAEPQKNNYSDQEKIDQLKKLSISDFKEKTGKPYVLIIDEINRGNVSQIFGELITLIEKDKRAGNKEALEITLPYSKKKFSVPNNLHIIGTMNTADRSVEALDSALRRRFSFQEMMPDYEVLTKELGEKDKVYLGKGLYMELTISKILKTINNRIEILIDRDHTIGHSYFLKLKTTKNFVKDLKSIFKDKIIPLLQEYFFNDYGKIQLVLGNVFIEQEKKKVTFATANADIETSDYDEKIIYKIVKDYDLKEALDALLGNGENDQKGK